MLSPEEINAARAKYGITPSSSSLDMSNSGQQSNMSGDKLMSFLNDNKTQQEINAPQRNKGILGSEVGFGQSIAAGILGNGGAGVSDIVNKANELTKQVTDNLINAIHVKQASGQDASRLINALKSVSPNISLSDIVNQSTGNSLNKTNQQVLGEATGVATDILGAGALPGKALGVAKATSIGSGILQGAKTGAIGGALFGGAQGVSTAMQDNKSGANIALEGAKGALTGGASGAVLGGAIGGVSGGIMGAEERKASTLIAKQDKATKYATDLASPKVTTKVAEQGIEQGRLNSPGLFKPASLKPDKRTTRIGGAIKDVVSPKNSVAQNVEAINNKVNDLADETIKYVKENKVPFNMNQLKKQLNGGSEDLKLVFASDSNAKKTYKAVVDEFMRQIKSGDTAGLLEARKSFDNVPAIKKLLMTDKLGENARKEIVLAVREAANNFVAKQLPEGNNFRELLYKQSDMLRALKNIAEKNTGVIGKNKLQLLTEKYPIMKWLIGGAATGLVGAAGIGVGNTIIKSTD